MDHILSDSLAIASLYSDMWTPRPDYPLITPIGYSMKSRGLD